MAFTIYVTSDWDQMSQVAAELIESDIRQKQTAKREYVLGLATGNSPTGIYKHLAKAFNAGRISPRTIRTFNLDEYVGLPGENPQQRALHCESYSYFMISEFFGLLREKFAETNVPWGTLVDQDHLVRALEDHKDCYEFQGTDAGKAIVIGDQAQGYLKTIKEEILDAYWKKIDACGGIDLQVIGVGGRGHVAFHESGIPFENNKVILVKLDENTVANAVEDGHFASREESPRYAVSMGAEQVYRAKTVVLVANGSRKTGPVTEAVLGEVTPDVPISYGQKYAARGGNMVYVLDEVAAAEVLKRSAEVKAKGYRIVDKRGEPFAKVESLTFIRDVRTGRLG
ncbi:MAG TPA: glucosamine-6-phosphate deaminase [Syntrophobacteraceae bacterium]|nr:glucosamine-6-phosphate deaminase [Syntrophobacteraceae bacterium]